MDGKHYDVGIFGWWYNGNYGANLTYYALNKAVQDLGYSVCMLWRSVSSPNEPDNVPLRFAHKYYNISPRYSKNNLVKYNDLCDSFLLGSDQLWNPDLEKVAGDEFFFSFVNEERVKVAYAQSFGNHTTVPNSFLKKYSKYIKSFDAISVREKYGEYLCKTEFDIEAPQVCDPVFLVSPNEFRNLGEQSDYETPKHYAVKFLLDPDHAKIEKCKNICSELGLEKTVNLTDLDRSAERAKLFEGEEVFANASIESFVKVYANADYIITDSFHGTCLAIILNKPFISIANHKRGVRRFESLLEGIGLEDRLFNKVEDIRVSELSPILYEKVNETIQKFREVGIQWLKKALQKSKVITRALSLSKKCMGCGACVNCCPKDALSLKPDEFGYYRAYDDYHKCVDCGQCSSVCPALNLPKKCNLEMPECFAYQAKDEELLEKSSSGGVFSALAEAMLKKGGKVCGVSWAADFKAVHIIISNKDELNLLRKSKYLQSYVGTVFREIKGLLESGTGVLFSGCPCQVAGLKNYLKKNYDNLILVDLLCGNSPSTWFFQKYLEDSFPQGISDYSFRYKKREKNWNPGWRADVARAIDINGKEIIHYGPCEDNYQRVYHNHTMCPQHCETCQYQEVPRFGDLTIGDFWGYDRHSGDIDVKKGVSVVLCNNNKGKKYYESINPSEIAFSKKVPFEWIGGNGFIKRGSQNFASVFRDKFYDSVTRMPFSSAIDYAMKPNRGVYRSVYENSDSFLQYDIKQLWFSFESDIWDELFIRNKNNEHILVVKNPHEKPGHYATLPLNKKLKKGESYNFKLKFRIRTLSKLLNLHIKDSGSKIHQIINSIKLEGIADGNKWVEKSFTFIPNADLYDEFMIGASQLSGEGNFISFEYINIQENNLMDQHN